MIFALVDETPWRKAYEATSPFTGVRYTIVLATEYAVEWQRPHSLLTHPCGLRFATQAEAQGFCAGVDYMLQDQP